MSNKAFLREKNCSPCSIRLDKIGKHYIRTVSSEELLDKLNANKLSIQAQQNIILISSPECYNALTRKFS
jgi:hypothetical protein